MHYTNQRAAEPAADEGVPERAAAVVGAMRHAWGGYVEHAWGADELQPVNKTGTKTYGGLAATIIDSMSTLHLMGLHDEFARCAPRRRCTALHLGHHTAGIALRCAALSWDGWATDKEHREALPCRQLQCHGRPPTR